MHYLALAPSLIAGCILSVIDVRSRRVPRVIVGCGLVSQLTVLFVLSLNNGSWSRLVNSVGLGFACGLVQVILCLVRPGAMGLGDASALTLMGVAVAWEGGLTGICLLWFVMGTVGCVGLWLARQRGRDSIAFVPVIVASAAISLALSS